MQNHFAKAKGKNQSGNVKNKVFVIFGFLLDLNVVEGREVRSTIVISEVCFNLSLFFRVDEFEGLSANVVKCSIDCFPFFILIIETKDPHISQFNEGVPTIRIFLLHFHIFEVFVKGKADLANGGQLLVFARVDNKVLVRWVLIDFITFFLVDDEVHIKLNFSDCMNFIVECVYTFIYYNLFELLFGIVPEVKVNELHFLSLVILIEKKFGVIVAGNCQIKFFELMLPFDNRFGITFFQILNIVVEQMPMITFVPAPAEQLGLYEVFHVSSIYLSIHCGAPLFPGFQVNE